MAKVPHAIEQALARYGLKLSWSDLRELEIACRDGAGRVQRMRDGSERHLVSIHGKAMVAVYLPEDYLIKQYKAKPHLVDQVTPLGRIITILPKEAVQPGRGLSRTILPSKYSRKGGLSSRYRAWRKGEDGKK